MVPIIFAAQVLAASCQAPPPPPKKDAGKVVSLFSFEDYPAEAVHNGWQGIVQASITVDKTGKVAACRIIRSSGYQVLDRKTCEIITTRARFVPALDDHCNPMDDVVVSPPITWRLYP